MSAYSILFLSIFLSRSDCLSVSLCLSLYKIKVKIVLPLSLSLSHAISLSLYPISTGQSLVVQRAYRPGHYNIWLFVVMYTEFLSTWWLPIFLSTRLLFIYSEIQNSLSTCLLEVLSTLGFSRRRQHFTDTVMPHFTDTHRWIFACDGFSQRCITTQTHTDADKDTDADTDTATATATQHTHTPAVHARVFAEEAQHFVYIRRSEYCV